MLIGNARKTMSRMRCAIQSSRVQQTVQTGLQGFKGVIEQGCRCWLTHCCARLQL